VRKNDYFKGLVSLFEDISTQNVAPASEDNFNPDAGANVEDDVQDVEISPETTGDEQPNEDAINSELGDADYLSAEGGFQPNLPPAVDSIEVSESKKMAKLFDLFKDLLNYSSVFHETLTTINIDILDAEKINKLRKNINHVDQIIEKLKDYIIKNFPTEKYEKALYVYILLRTELMTVIKLLRESLDLNRVADLEKDKIKKEKE
jgi:hypothetical protein